MSDDEMKGNGDPPEKRRRSSSIDPINPEPSIVVHVRNLSSRATEADLLEALTCFGPVAYATCMPGKRMALVEFEDVEGARACVNKASNGHIFVAGEAALFNYSTSKSIQRFGMESERPNHVLILTVYNVQYPINVDVIYKICEPHGNVKRIAIIRHATLQALVEFDNAEEAKKAKHALNGADIYSGCCTLKVEFAKHQAVKVTRNGQDQRDYTGAIPAADEPRPRAKETRKPLLVNEEPVGMRGGDGFGVGRGRGAASEGGYGGYPGSRGDRFSDAGHPRGDRYDSGGYDLPRGDRYAGDGAYNGPRGERYSGEGAYGGPPRRERYGSESGFGGPPRGERFSSEAGYGGPPRGDRYGDGFPGAPRGERFGSEGGYSGPPRGERFGAEGGYGAPPRGERYGAEGGYGGARGDYGSGPGHPGGAGRGYNNGYGARSEDHYGRRGGGFGSGEGGFGRGRGGGYDDSDWEKKKRSDGGYGPVLMIYGLDQSAMNCDKLFNLLCLYGNCDRIKFMKSKSDTAMAQMGSVREVYSAIDNLQGTIVCGSKITLRPSMQECLHEVRVPFDLPDGTPSYRDYSESRNQRFSTREMAMKNRIVRPTNVLHWYNAPATMTEDKLVELFACREAPTPTAVTIFPSRSERSSAGVCEFESTEEAVRALVFANHTPVESPFGKAPYIVKLGFASDSFRRSSRS